MATSKPTLQIELSAGFRGAARALPKVQRRDIGRVIDAVRDAFGKPHLHSGLGIRRLRRNYFECRVGLHIRLIFRAEPGVLHFLTSGTHNAVKNFMKSL